MNESGVALASARAGNVIGGGDWATDRLIPDFLKAIDLGETLVVRSPASVRPWQHVLEPLSGYLALAEKLYTDGKSFAEGWNFGPTESDARNVEWIIQQLVSATPGSNWRVDDKPQPHEANYLKLDSSKARNRLGWQPRWNLSDALQHIMYWHKAWHAGDDMHATTLRQISEYESSRVAN